MNFESLVPFALIITPFLLIFLIEAFVLYFFKLKKFWAAIGFSLLLNLVTLALIFYGLMPLLSKLGYQLTGLPFPLPVMFFLWWFSSISDGLLLQFLMRKKEGKQIFLASLSMNALSYLVFYLFIFYSH